MKVDCEKEESRVQKLVEVVQFWGQFASLLLVLQCVLVTAGSLFTKVSLKCVHF